MTPAAVELGPGVYVADVYKDGVLVGTLPLTR